MQFWSGSPWPTFLLFLAGWCFSGILKQGTFKESVWTTVSIRHQSKVSHKMWDIWLTKMEPRRNASGSHQNFETELCRDVGINNFCGRFLPNNSIECEGSLLRIQNKEHNPPCHRAHQTQPSGIYCTIFPTSHRQRGYRLFSWHRWRKAPPPRIDKERLKGLAYPNWLLEHLRPFLESLLLSV